MPYLLLDNSFSLSKSRGIFKSSDQDRYLAAYEIKRLQRIGCRRLARRRGRNPIHKRNHACR
jgi:hypothetical protein